MIDVDQARAQRIARALTLIESRSYLRTAGALMVYSDRPEVVGGGYTLEPGLSCPCPDSTYRAQGLGIRCAREVVRDLLDAADEHDADAARQRAGARLQELEEMFNR